MVGVHSDHRVQKQKTTGEEVCVEYSMEWGICGHMKTAIKNMMHDIEEVCVWVPIDENATLTDPTVTDDQKKVDLLAGAVAATAGV